jgi:hypothetical protein
VAEKVCTTQTRGSTLHPGRLSYRSSPSTTITHQLFIMTMSSSFSTLSSPSDLSSTLADVNELKGQYFIE